MEDIVDKESRELNEMSRSQDEDENYFQKMSQVVKSGGHKLKSKLKPENVGLLLPGDFLPGIARCFDDEVALRVCQKSNHLYSWKSVACSNRPAIKERERESVSVVRNIRPKNRKTFLKEKTFYSAIDTNFYRKKCDEVLLHEQNFENKKHKNKEKRKKPCETRDTFYFDAFMSTAASGSEKQRALTEIRQLRKKAINAFLDDKFPEFQKHVNKKQKLMAFDTKENEELFSELLNLDESKDKERHEVNILRVPRPMPVVDDLLKCVKSKPVLFSDLQKAYIKAANETCVDVEKEDRLKTVVHLPVNKKINCQQSLTRRICFEVVQIIVRTLEEKGN
eukprot:snap_masked-scaffold_50-processed-gene-0.40-mRNA-1 protein AED:1.00 eAED:1.00 QI:0/-1/0/0/-1/1/1/0/335